MNINANRKEKLIDSLLEAINDGLIRSTSWRSFKSFGMADYYIGLGKILRDKEKIKKEKRKIINTLYYLKKANLIIMSKKDGKLKLSDKGFFRVILNKSRKMESKKIGSYFYLVIFDIPEEMRVVRNLFRRVLYNFGSDRIQKSVFIVENEKGHRLIKDLIRRSKVNEYVKIVKCLKIE